MQPCLPPVQNQLLQHLPRGLSSSVEMEPCHSGPCLYRACGYPAEDKEWLLKKLMRAHPEVMSYQANSTEREARRLKWTTVENLLLWHEGFEKLLVDELFGFVGTEHKVVLVGPDGKQREGLSKLWLYAGMHLRIFNVDETSIGGFATQTRRRKTPGRRGKPSRKSKQRDNGKHNTLNQGTSAPDYPRRATEDPNGVPVPAVAGGAAVVLPPQVILASDAKDPSTKKPEGKVLEACPPGTQIHYTKSGSANSATLEAWIDMVIATCRANGIEVRDELKKRIIIKLDGGPALDLSPDWLQRQKAKGVILFPGLPNGSSANQEMDQLYNFLKQTLADVRGELLKQRQKANEDIRNDQLRRRAAGEYGPTNKLVPETISNRQDLPTLLGEPLQKAMSPGHVNGAWMKVGAYPATRADMQGDGVQNGEATDELKTLIAENQRLAQELERNNIPNKFARQDLWVGANNKLGSAVLVAENQDGGPFSSTGRIWRWAGARALTSDFVLNGMRREIERKARDARAAEVELEGKQTEKTEKKRGKLKKLWENADAVWRKCAAADGTKYEDSLVDLSNSDLRKISKYVYRQLYNKDDQQALMLKKGMKAPEVQSRVLAFVRTHLLVQAVRLRPVRDADSGCWTLPSCVD